MSDKAVIRYLPGLLSVEVLNRFICTVSSSGNWASAGADDKNYIQTDINRALIRLEEETKDWPRRPTQDDIELHLDKETALAVYQSPEYRSYIHGSPDAVAAITDWWNPNRRFGFPPLLYGIVLKIEGVRYPNPELTQLVREVVTQLQNTVRDFDQKARKILTESAADEPPLVVTYAKENT